MSPRTPFNFEEGVWRELDQLREGVQRQNELLERAIERFGRECDDLKDEVSQVKISVAELRRDPPVSRRGGGGGLMRDGGLTVSGATAGALIAALAQWLASPPVQPPPQPAPSALTAPAPQFGGR
jgi:hypothetical protein